MPNWWNYRHSADFIQNISHRIAGRSPILERTSSQILMQRAERFAAAAFDAAADTLTAMVSSDSRHLGLSFAQSGLAMSPFPETLGGAGLADPSRHSELCTILRLLGSADLSLARLFEGHLNAVSLVARYGDPNSVASLCRSVSHAADCPPSGEPMMRRACGSWIAAPAPGPENSGFRRWFCHRPPRDCEGGRRPGDVPASAWHG